MTLNTQIIARVVVESTTKDHTKFLRPFIKFCEESTTIKELIDWRMSIEQSKGITVTSNITLVIKSEG